MVNKTYEMESETLSKEVHKTIKIINYEISNLDSTAMDWAYWDDTYYYAINQNNDYISHNLMDDTFSILKINFFVIIDNNGKILYKKAYGSVEEKELDFPQSLEDSIVNTDIFLIDETDGAVRGILTNEDVPVFLASRPILKSDYTGPIVGTLIIGKFVDSREVSTLSEIAPYPMNLYKMDDKETKQILGNLPPDFLESGKVTSKAISDSIINGYYILKDVYGEPGLILEIELPRDAYIASKQAGFYFFIIMLGFGILFGVSFLLALEKGILSKIFTLEKEVKKISTKKDYSSRLNIHGDDEIDSLASNINEMIENIQKSSAVLKESEERYRTLFEESMDAIWTTELDGKIIAANEASAKLLDIPLNQLIGSNILDFYEFPEDRIEFQNKVDEFGSVKEYPLNLKTKKGERIYCLISFSTWRDNKGKVIGYRGIVHNITNRKNYERQLLELNDTLKVINKILRHDILNELTVVMSLCDMIETKDHSLKEKMIKTIYKSVNLIEKMRELEQAVTLGGQMKIYNLQDAINEVIKNYSNIKFSISGDCNVVADGALSSVIDNLVRNAVVHGKTDKIDFKIENEEKSCILKVIDYGYGIPEDIKKNIFDEGTSFGENKGSGLGLYIVKKVIERYGGVIGVQDNKPRGTVFVVKFNNLRDKS
ncbi:MAG: PAS domain S-box protein [Candidatus Methanofastidiosum sp.]|nr:PAS domain S-box protein [Methanofastidiosum sp.]